MALVLDLSPGPVGGPGLLTRPPVDDRCPPIPGAAGKVAELRAVLRRFGYDVRPSASEPCETGEQVEALIDGVLGAPGEDRVVLVHVLANASWQPPRTRDDKGLLVLLDRRGHQLPNAVNHLVQRLLGGGASRGESLLVLDCTEAGRMAALQDRLVPLSVPRRHWVLAACGAGRHAYDGRLTEALATVLRRVLGGGLDLDASVAHADLRRVGHEVNEELRRLALADGFPQEIDPRPAGLPRGSAFFPLPGPRGAAASALAGAGPAARHFLDRVAPSWLDADGEPHPAFFGRSALIARLRDWAAGQGPALQVVTGRPGAGKSAVLGALACSVWAVVPDDLRAAIAGRDRPLPVVPDLAVVHARNQVLEEVTASLARQWRLDGASRPGVWTVEDLVQALSARDQPPCLVLDALDEARAPEELARVLLSRLTRDQRPDGRPLGRLLVAVRHPDRFPAMLERARAGDGSGCHDLDRDDAPHRADLRAALAGYLGLALGLDRDPGLAGAVPGPALGPQARAEFARVLLDGLMAGGTAACGEFLLATLHVRFLLQRPDPPGTPEQARELAEDLLKLDLSGILDQDLRLMESRNPGPGWARPVATLLARAPGSGMDRDTLTAALTGAAVYTLLGMPGPPAPGDIARALDDLRFYLRGDVDEEGVRVYRLFHQDLVDALKRGPLIPAAGGA